MFISYARHDLHAAEQLERALQAHDIAVWRDQESIYGGEQWPKAIGEVIAAHDHVMLLWSKTAAQSHFVEFEWNTAVALRKTILPCGHMATTSWLFVIFDTAGEVSASYAAALSAISLANGVIRVFAREVSKNHSPSRKTFSPTAVRMCPKHTRLRPL